MKDRLTAIWSCIAVFVGIFILALVGEMLARMF